MTGWSQVGPELPQAQREVVVPLIAWQLSVDNPAFELVGELGDAVIALIDSLGADLEHVGERLEERLRSAGVSMALLQELRLRTFGAADAYGDSP